jgi:addiction module RelE/StbE family toxin
MKLLKTEFYSKKERAFLKKHSNLFEKYKETLRKLELDPFSPALKTHKLKGDLKDFYACSINYEYRIVFIILIQDDEITLFDVGTHDEVY